MPKKRYSAHNSDSRLAVNETVPHRYGRSQKGKNAFPGAVRLAVLRKRLRKPVKRSKRDIAWALAIVGIGEGPKDLSTRAREYLDGRK